MGNSVEKSVEYFEKIVIKKEISGVAQFLSVIITAMYYMVVFHLPLETLAKSMVHHSPSLSASSSL